MCVTSIRLIRVASLAFIALAMLVAGSLLAVSQNRVRANDDAPKNVKPVLLDRFLDVKGDHLKPLRDQKFVLEEATWDAKKQQLTYKGWWTGDVGGFKLRPYRWDSGMCNMVWLDAAGKKITDTRDFKVTDTGANDPKTGYLRVWLTIDFSDESVARAVSVQINDGKVIGLK